MDELRLSALIAILSSVSWFASLYAISLFGPWGALASMFPYDESVRGTTHGFVSLSVGLLSYSNCLKAISNRDQLTVMIMFPFRPFHPPFTIPRNEVTDIKVGRFLFVPRVKFVVASYRITMYGSIANSEFWDAN